MKFNDIHIKKISQEMPQPSITKIYFENYISKISFKFPRGQWVKMPTHLRWRLSKKTPSGSKINLICLVKWGNCVFENIFSQSVVKVFHCNSFSNPQMKLKSRLQFHSPRFPVALLQYVEANLCTPVSSEIRNTYSGALTWLDWCVRPGGK